MFSRPYTDPDDLPLLLEFLRAAREPARLADFPGLTDLEEILADPATCAQTRLWFQAEGQMTGYGILTSYENLLFESLPAAAPTLDPEILAWGLALARAQGYLLVETSCPDADLARQALLAQAGFSLEEETSLHYRRALQQPIPAPSLPPGFSLRPLNGEAEAEAAAELHRAAFGTDYMSLENRLAMMRTSAYDPRLDLVAVAPDGRLAAYTMGLISAAENAVTGEKIGQTDPVATHPDFQRLGLARALLLAGMQLLKERGLETARLGTSSANLAMQKAAEAVGFVVVSRTLHYYRQVT